MKIIRIMINGKQNAVNITKNISKEISMVSKLQISKFILFIVNPINKSKYEVSAANFIHE